MTTVSAKLHQRHTPIHSISSHHTLLEGCVCSSTSVTLLQIGVSGSGIAIVVVVNVFRHLPDLQYVVLRYGCDHPVLVPTPREVRDLGAVTAMHKLPRRGREEQSWDSRWQQTTGRCIERRRTRKAQGSDGPITLVVHPQRPPPTAAHRCGSCPTHPLGDRFQTMLAPVIEGQVIRDTVSVETKWPRAGWCGTAAAADGRRAGC
jgi:hypothetical protein